MNNIEKIIKERHSVRSYLDKKIEQDKVDILNELISSINQKVGLNIQFIIDDGDVFDKFIFHYGRLKNCKNYIALIGKNDSLLEEKIGYYGEQIVLKAQELGLNTCWVGGTYKKSSVSAMIGVNERLVCLIAIGYGQTNGVERKRKNINDVTNSNNYPDWFKKGIEFALLAPTAMNQQKFKFEYINDTNVKALSGNGILTNVDLGIAKYHFELGANIKINWL